MRTGEALKPAIKALCRALQRLGAPFMLIGGVAVQARGFARSTGDVDATVRADQVTLSRLTRSLARSHTGYPREIRVSHGTRHQFGRLGRAQGHRLA